MTLERAGRIDDAVDAYAGVLDVSPEHVATMQAMALCQVRHTRRDARTSTMLREIAMRGETEEWRSWARDEMTQDEEPS